MLAYEKAIIQLNEILGILNTVKNDSIVLKSLCSSLYDVLRTIENTNEAILVANSNMSVLEEVCNAKTFTLPHIAINLLIQIYRKILINAPGYAVRNVVTTMLGIMSNKNSSNNSRECVVSVIGPIILGRAFDCGSMMNDIIQSILKLLKSSSDTSLRIASIKALHDITIGGEARIQDMHAEIVKSMSKLVSDKVIEIRQLSAQLIDSIARFSSGCVSVPAETLLALTTKGVDDENPIVQDSFCRTVASIYIEQINAYADAQEKVKIGLARGGSTESPVNTAQKKPTISRGLSISKLVTSQKKPVVEEYTFKSVVNTIIKQIIKSTNGQKSSSSLIILGYVISDCIYVIEQVDYEWLISTITGILRDPIIINMSYEDKVYFRSRLSYIFRHSITFNLTEALQLVFVSQLSQFLGSVEQHNEDELQFVLNELSHLLKILGEAAGSMVDEIHMSLTLHLRHSSFGVRSAAAYVFMSLAHVGPSLAAQFVTSSLSHAQTQVKLLTIYDGLENGNSGSGTLSGDIYEDSMTSDANTTISESSSSSSKKRSNKENDRLQKMYTFHGHTLVISILLSHEKSLPTGFPKKLIMDLFEFGLTLLLQDVLSAPAAYRHVSCSVVRAGSLIVSSCLNLGYNMNRSKLIELLTCCDGLIKLANGSTATQDDDILFELMTVEAALVCISTMLWYCPDALIYESDCLSIIVDDLEIAYRAIKSKYQPKFRTHFRFRTLHMILLECYSWLPPFSFNSSCQQIFVEALRVFRDSISSSYICTCLSDIIPKEYDILLTTIKAIPQNMYGLNTDMPYNEQIFMIKLESYALALQKKESEAVLGLFGKESNGLLLSAFENRVNWYQPITPPAQIDARTIDSSIGVISATFNTQSTEYKIKAMQLFSQAISQCLSTSAIIASSNNTSSLSSSSSSTSSSSSSLSSSSTSSLFSNDEEKRRKEKKNFITMKNVTTALMYIIRALPDPFYDSNINTSDDLAWFQLIIDRLIEILGYIASIEIRCTAASALYTILSKLTNEGKFLEALIENLFTRIHGILIAAIDKKNETMIDYGGYLLALGGLWRNSPSNPPQPDVYHMKKGGMSLRDRILSCIMDCLRRVDTSVLFRSHGIMAFNDIIEHLEQVYSKHSNPNDSSFINSILPIVVNICTVLDIHSSAVNTFEDYEQLDICIIRVLGKLGRLVLRIYITSPNRYEFKDVAVNCCRIWDSSQELSPFSSHPLLKQEHAIFLQSIIPYLYTNKSSHGSIGSYSDIISKTYVVSILNQAITSRYTLSLPTLLATVESIAVLIKMDSDLVTQGGLDLSLFTLLDWTIGTAPTGMTQGYAGLEFKTSFCPSSIDQTKLTLRKNIEDAILSLINQDIATYPHQRITYWILLSRAIGLSLRSIDNSNSSSNDISSTGNTIGSDRDTGEDRGGENDEEVSGISIGPSSKSTGNGNLSPDKLSQNNGAYILSYQQWILKFRDYVIAKVQDLPPTRIQIKYFAIICANIAINHLSNVVYMIPTHVDLKLAREEMNRILSKRILLATATSATPLSLSESEKTKNNSNSNSSSNINNTSTSNPTENHINIMASSISDGTLVRDIGPNGDGIRYLPCYAILFLQDFISFACAISSFTINDKRLLYIQYQAMLLLQKLINIFIDSVDPDVIDIGKNSNNNNSSITNNSNNSSMAIEQKLLHQFVSQLLSTVRPALSERGCPGLIFASGSIVIELIGKGYISDKVIIRRLIKSMSSYVERISKSLSTMTMTNNSNLSDMMQTTESKVADSNMVSDMNLLEPMINNTVLGSPDMSNEISIIDYIVNASNMAKLQILLSEDRPNDRLNKDIVETIASAIKEYVPILSNMWTNIIIDSIRIFRAQHNSLLDEIDLRRGGITFTPFANMNDIISYYKDTYSTILLAKALTTTVTTATPSSLPSSSKLSTREIFILLFSHVKDLLSRDTIPSKISIAPHKKNKAISSAINSFVSLSKSSQHTIPIIEWIRLLSYLMINTSNSSSNNDSDNDNKDSNIVNIQTINDMEIVYAIILLSHTIAMNELTMISNESKSNSDMELIDKNISTLASYVWIFSLMVIGQILPSMYTEKSITDIKAKLINGQLSTLNKKLSSNEAHAILTLSIPLIDQSFEGIQSSSKAMNLVTYIIESIVLSAPLVTIDNQDIYTGNDDIMEYSSDVLISIFFHIALYWSPKSISKSYYIKSILQAFKDLQSKISSSQSYYSNISYKLLQEFFSHFLFYDYSVIVNYYSSVPGTENIVLSFVEIVLTMWKDIAILIPDKTTIILPVEMITTLFVTQPVTILFRQSCLQIILSIIQTDRMIGPILSETLLPGIISILSNTTISPEIEIILIQILFVVFGTLEAHTKSGYISYILKPLCKLFSRNQYLDTISSQFAAKAITHLARANPEILRDQVPKLDEKDRLVLQATMRLSMEQQQRQQQQEQQQQQNHTSSSSSGSLPSIKKLDITKFKK